MVELKTLSLRAILCATVLGAGLASASVPVSTPCVNAHATSAIDVTEAAAMISVHCGEAPSAWQSADGRLWVVFVQNQIAWLSHSDDVSAGFSTPVAINPVAENIEVNGENRPKIVVDHRPDYAGHVYVSWTQKTEGMHTGDIRFTRSLDGGQSFEPVRTINDDGLLTSHRFDSLFQAESGHLYLSWLDKRELEAAAERGEAYTGSAVFYAVSADQGASFSSNTRVASHSCECCRIAVAPSGSDGMALMWRQVFDGSTRDHAMSRVGPAGEVQEFSRATVDEWKIDACPHHGPAIAQQDENGYHMSWFSAGDLHKGIYYGYHDLTKGVTSQLRQVDASAGAGHPQLAVWQDEVLMVWKRFDGRQTDVLLMRSSDKGQSWSSPQTLMSTSNASDYPLLVTGPQGVHVSWLTRADGYQWLALPPRADNDRADNDRAEDETADIHPFLADTFASLKQQRAGQPFILALWSVDCPPCMVELDMLGKLRQQYPELPLVLVSTDNIRLKEDASDFLLDYGLHDLPSWMFADAFAESLRFSIDPQWYGELPRGYFFDENHQAHAHSGIMSEQLVRGWLGL